MKKKVLVFPCGSEIGLEVYNSVKDSTHFELFGLSSVKDHGEFVYKNYIGGVGLYTDPNFIEDLKFTIKKYGIDILYPTMDSIIPFLKYHEDDLAIPVVGPAYEVAKLCSSKLDTYNLLADKIRVPKVYSRFDDNIQYPIFVKPDIGYGSRNTFKIDSIEQLKRIDITDKVVCEFLPGKEYTVDCFTDLYGRLTFTGARERSRTVNGISVNTKSSADLSLEFYELAKIINENIKFCGSWFFQIKRDSNGEPCLLEIACRFAGSSSVHRIKGINFALANLYLVSGINPHFIVNSFEVELDRALSNNYKLDVLYDTIFIDYDDTIIVNNEVNLEAISLIFDAINTKKKVILITKHKGDLEASLKKFKLNHLFDSIIHLKERESKVHYISKLIYEKAIFIDDSFSERKAVFENLKIPVFSVDSIKSLLN